ncbi:MAG: DUF885 domain-containing protein [Caulobacteraceae bacterium]|nr:DUF885 domain-containing protein [Caulobacteraceae bacterium]
MPFNRRVVLRGAASALALGAAPAFAADSPDAAADRLLEQITEQMLRDYPETATGSGVDKGARAGLRSKLSDHSAAGQRAVAAHARETLNALTRLDTRGLSDGKRLDVEVVRTVYQLANEGFAFPYGDMAILNNNWSYRNSPYSVAQNLGAFFDIPSFLDSSHTIAAAEDAEAYLARMGAYAAQLDGETDRVRSDADRGAVLPDFLLDKTLRQMRAGRNGPAAGWGIVASLARRAAAANLPSRHTAEAERIASERIAPALDRQIAVLDGLRSRATSDAGAWKLPAGEAYYAWALRAGTTTTMTPDEVHQMGLDELHALHARMDPILRSIGYTEGSVGARMTALGSDPRYQFADGDPGRAEIMAFIQEKLADIRTRIPRAFNTPVRGFLEVVRISPDIEAGAPGGIGGPGTIDGKEPGHFWINLRSTGLHTKFDLADLTYHEAIPGHVWQGEYTFRQSLLRSILGFNAYSEGWALYAQQIADELGVYDDFPVGRLGYLQSLAFRACRLVVDTGLHAKRWTRQQGVDFFVRENGSNPDSVGSEVDRYCVWPGQACGYKVGHTAINRQRDRAKAELAGRYDFRDFNDAVVGSGNVPMTVLDQVIGSYIAKAKGA